MEAESSWALRETVDAIYKREGPRVLATLIRLLGDFDLAEDAMQAAFVAAVDQWGKEGAPINPRAWLVSTGRFEAIDAMRRETRLFASLREVAKRQERELETSPLLDDGSIEDERLCLIFTCCHPSISAEGQAALTLRDVCGLSTEEIARAFLTSASVIAQRIVRAKAKIREEKVEYIVPPRGELSDRTGGVLQVTYLLYNEGYYASSGEVLTRQVLSGEAIRLGRLIAELLPEPEVLGLLALMLLQESRRAARASSNGDVILLADQDTALWNRGMIAEGLSLCARSIAPASPGFYALQAGIAATHIQGALEGETDWNRIVGFYDLMLDRNPSAVVELNRAVAVSMRDGPTTGLELLDNLLARGELDGYGLAQATRGDFCRRLGRFGDAGESYSRAIALTCQAAERRFLESRLREVTEALERI